MWNGAMPALQSPKQPEPPMSNPNPMRWPTDFPGKHDKQERPKK